MPKQTTFLKVSARLTTRTELLGAIEQGETVRVATLNPEFMLEARKNNAFREALSHMTHCTVDGTGLYWYLKRLHLTQLIEQYQGADLVQNLFERYSDGSRCFYLLGGPSTEQNAAAILQRYPKLVIVGAQDGGTPIREELVQEVQQTKPDIVLVGFGAPLQELWIDQTSGEDIPVMIGVGGSLDFYGSKKRAPQFMRTLHLEWLYRSFTEMGHFKRAFKAVVIFPLYVLFSGK